MNFTKMIRHWHKF